MSRVTSSSATIQWKKPVDDGNSPVLHYVLEKRESGATSWSKLITLPSSSHECELENMSPGKDYFVRISAVNKYGMGTAAELKEPIRVKGEERRKHVQLT